MTAIPALETLLSDFLDSFWKKNSQKFADAKECVTGILSLPNVGWDMDSEEAL